MRIAVYVETAKMEMPPYRSMCRPYCLGAEDAMMMMML